MEKAQGKLMDVIQALADKAVSSDTRSYDALHLTQAVLNAAHAMQVLEDVKKVQQKWRASNYISACRLG